VKSEHTFVDEARITVSSGNGGDGIVAYRREKFVPRGGSSGGNGGRGGDVILIADTGLSTLSEFHHRQQISAEPGHKGGTNDRTGASGKSVEIRVPVGTMIHDEEDDEDAPPLVDLTEPGQRFVAATGGKGGLGNARFKTSTRQTPDFFLPGLPGETRSLRLSLKLLADVGLVGFPNAGKSTLLRVISKAKPKVASYPFTTLTPSLGVVEIDDTRFVVADIPGLIEGASEGAGLGHRFLRHVERTRVLVHLLDVGAMLMEGRDLCADYDAIRHELARYQPQLLERREIVVLNKVDLVPDPAGLDEIKGRLESRGIRVRTISGATRSGIDALVRSMLEAVELTRQEELALIAEAETAGPE
jgi:GTP-binding protein